MRIYIGHDKREQAAFDVAVFTACKFGCDVQPLYENRLRLSGMLTRPVDNRGQMYDLNSAAPQSTDFAVARFFVPLLAHSGWAMFVDCDMLFMSDPNVLLEGLDKSKAVYCVKHREFKSPKEISKQVTYEGSYKMDGQLQTLYRRKLWSSVMIFNCDHPANSRLNLMILNSWPGRDLHAFNWLDDQDIGELPPEANWLVNLQEKPETPIIAHYTLGIPLMPGHETAKHAELWLNAYREMTNVSSASTLS